MRKQILYFLILIFSSLISQPATSDTFETIIPNSKSPLYSRESGSKLNCFNSLNNRDNDGGAVGNQFSEDSIIIIASKDCRPIDNELSTDYMTEYILLDSSCSIIKRLYYNFSNDSYNSKNRSVLLGDYKNNQSILGAILKKSGSNQYNDFDITDYSDFFTGIFGYNIRYSYSALYDSSSVEHNPDFDIDFLDIKYINVARTLSDNLIIVLNNKRELWCFYVGADNKLISKKKLRQNFGKEIKKLSEIIALNDTTFALVVDWEKKKESKATILIANTSGEILMQQEYQTDVSLKSLKKYHHEILVKIENNEFIDFYTEKVYESAKPPSGFGREADQYFKSRDWVKAVAEHLNATCYSSTGTVLWDKKYILEFDSEVLKHSSKDLKRFIDACQISNGDIALMYNNLLSSKPPHFILLSPNGDILKQSHIGTMRAYKHRLSPTLDGGALAVGIYLDDPDSSTIHVMKFDSLGNIDKVIIDPNILLVKAKNILNQEKIHTNDSLKTALTDYLKVLNIDPHNTDALWGTANIFEYVGEYALASECYQSYLKETDSLADATKKTFETFSGIKALLNDPGNEDLLLEQGFSKDSIEALFNSCKKFNEIFNNGKRLGKAHLITCQYLAKKGNTKSTTQKLKTTLFSNSKLSDKSANLVTFTDSIDFSDEAIKNNSKWQFIKDLLGTVAVTGSLTALGGDDATIQKGLNLLDEWLDAPKGQKIEARNNLIAGMLGEITSLIVRRKLNIPVENALAKQGYISPESPPQELTNVDADIKDAFNNTPINKSKEYKVSDNFKISIKWNVSQIAGEYECIHSSSSQECAEIGKSGTMIKSNSAWDKETITNSPLIITQSGEFLTLESYTTIVVAPFEGFVPIEYSEDDLSILRDYDNGIKWNVSLNDLPKETYIKTSGYSVKVETKAKGKLIGDEAVINSKTTIHQSSSTSSSRWNSSNVWKTDATEPYSTTVNSTSVLKILTDNRIKFINSESGVEYFQIYERVNK